MSSIASARRALHRPPIRRWSNFCSYWDWTGSKGLERTFGGMVTVIGEVTSWVRTLAIAIGFTLIGMSVLGALFIWYEPNSSIPDLLSGTTFDQQMVFLSREGLAVWRMTIDPDHQQLFLLDWVIRNLTVASAALVLGLGLRAEGNGPRAALYTYGVGFSLAAFALPYLYRIVTGAQPYFHLILDVFNPFYVSASAPLAIVGAVFGLLFSTLRGPAIRRRVRFETAY